VVVVVVLVVVSEFSIKPLPNCIMIPCKKDRNIGGNLLGTVLCTVLVKHLVMNSCSY